VKHALHFFLLNPNYGLGLRRGRIIPRTLPLQALCLGIEGLTHCFVTIIDEGKEIIGIFNAS